jgi:hypothetical protein
VLFEHHQKLSGWTTQIFLSLHAKRGKLNIIKKLKSWRIPLFWGFGQLKSCPYNIYWFYSIKSKFTKKNWRLNELLAMTAVHYFLLNFVLFIKWQNWKLSHLSDLLSLCWLVKINFLQKCANIGLFWKLRD